MKNKENKQGRLLDSISALEFANRFARSIQEQSQRFTWFLGAGCSITSGIPAAGQLVERWLSELSEMQQITGSEFNDWIKKTFPSFSHENPALSYAAIFKRRHPAPIDRQREIEMVCAQAEPAYGYATFAQLLSLSGVGTLCNTVLTTNFDDLVAEALYMYGERTARPQIISHETLTRYVRITSPRPTIVKLHGDAHLDPKNLTPETEEIAAEVAKHLYPFIQDSALIFAGYGGNDKSIAKFFLACPEAALASQVYWISKQNPPTNFTNWLIERGALRVDHTDFDRLLHHLRGALKIEHPKAERWKDNYEQYLKQYSEFETEIQQQPTSVEKSALLQVSEQANKSLPPDERLVYLAIAQKDPLEAEKIYSRGIAKYPDSASLHQYYGVLLINRLGQHEPAEREFRKAVELAPTGSFNYYNLATLLMRFGDKDEAGDLMRKAMELEPKSARFQAQYAVYLERRMEDSHQATEYFKKAAATDSNDAPLGVNFGQHLCLNGQIEEGLVWLQKGAKTEEGMIALRALFDLCAFGPLKPATMQAISTKLKRGFRVIDWDIERVVEFVEKDQPKEAPFIKALAKVVTKQSALSTLDVFPFWKKAIAALGGKKK